MLGLTICHRVDLIQKLEVKINYLSLILTISKAQDPVLVSKQIQLEADTHKILVVLEIERVLSLILVEHLPQRDILEILILMMKIMVLVAIMLVVLAGEVLVVALPLCNKLWETSKVSKLQLNSILPQKANKIWETHLYQADTTRMVLKVNSILLIPKLKDINMTMNLSHRLWISDNPLREKELGKK